MTHRGLVKRWRYRQTDGDVAAQCVQLARTIGVSPLVSQLLCQRGISSEETAKTFLSPKLTDLHDPRLLPGAERAAERLCQAIKDKQPIVIYGDYDVDGITASSILWHMLRLAGAQVTTYVPHRIEEGYGLNVAAIEQLATGAQGKPLIVSVDCGITACASADAAKRAGVDLIITDHHHLDENNLPEAHTLVHPRLPGSDYPFGDICGAGVAFKLVWQFARTFCGTERLPQMYREMLLDMVSLAALGTIADVVPLLDENRAIAAMGLGQIKRTKIVGLNALIDATRLRDEKVDSYHVGFVLGPRLNACGRMGHAGQAVQLLTDVDMAEGLRIARFLTQENEKRRATEKQIFSEAQQRVVEMKYDDASCRAIVLANENWHPGVVGIVASRLVEKFHRPVVMLNIEDGVAHGSARSIDGLSLYDALEHCKAHLKTFGGHEMAAGMSLDAANVDAFRTQMVAYVNERVAPDALAAVLDIDAPCALEALTVQMLRELRQLAPFGRSNPEPTLCLQEAELAAPPQCVGSDGSHLRLTLKQGACISHAIWFRQGAMSARLMQGMKLDVAFVPKLSMWQGRERAEMHIQDVRICGAEIAPAEVAQDEEESVAP